MRRTCKMVTLVIAALAFAWNVPAEEVFIHFEDMTCGDSVTGPGVLNPYLDLQPLNSHGDLVVVETFNEDPECGVVYRAPNRGAWTIMESNDSLEDENGNVVCSHQGIPEPGTAKGFANPDCAWLDSHDPKFCPQEFEVTFGYRRVYKFQMLMADFGDWNPTRSTWHQVALRAFENGVEVPYIIEYTTDPVTTPTWCTLGCDLTIEGDACDCQQAGLGHSHLEIHAPPGSNGFDRIVLQASDPTMIVTPTFCASALDPDPVGCDLCATWGCDPNAAFDSLAIGLVNLFDVHPVSCPNPLNLGRGGMLPAAVLGTAEFDVYDVMPETCTLEGVLPERSAYEDVSRPYVGGLVDPYSCTSEGPDGWEDLTLKYRNEDIVAAVLAANPDVSHGSVVFVHLVCDLVTGEQLTSEDVMVVRGGNPIAMFN